MELFNTLKSLIKSVDKTGEATMKAKLNKTGQISIPKRIGTALRLTPGAELTIEMTMDGEIILKPDVLISQYKHKPLPYPDTEDVIWRGTTDEYMAWVRDGGPNYFDARRPGEKTMSETAAENVAAFVREREALRREKQELHGRVTEPPRK